MSLYLLFIILSLLLVSQSKKTHQLCYGCFRLRSLLQNHSSALNLNSMTIRHKKTGFYQAACNFHQATQVPQKMHQNSLYFGVASVPSRTKKKYTQSCFTEFCSSVDCVYQPAVCSSFTHLNRADIGQMMSEAAVVNTWNDEQRSLWLRMDNLHSSKFDRTSQSIDHCLN